MKLADKRASKAAPEAANLWKADWPTAQQHHIDWWNHRGLVLWVTAPRDKPWEEIAPPPPYRDLEEFWFGAAWRLRRAEYELSRTYCGGDAFPIAMMTAGAGDLAGYLGSPLDLAPDTVWFNPCLREPVEAPPLLHLDRNNDMFRKTTAMVRTCVAGARGRFFVSPPDLVENIDVLASLRGAQDLLIDLVERPEWVAERIAQINRVFFAAFDHYYEMIKDPWGGNTFVFNIWGPGKTCKVQCDACSMFSPEMFRRFVLPALTEQCAWLDYAMYHLDGEQCLPHLDTLLEIEPLRAIEWTPLGCCRDEGGGRAKWYDLYRQILRAGKSVQAIQVKYEEVIPLLDAVGGRGMFITTKAETEADAHKLEEKAGVYR